MGIKTATEDLSSEASTGWKPVEASLVSLTGICYVSPVLMTLDTVRYTKHTCTLAKFHIMAR